MAISRLLLTLLQTVLFSFVLTNTASAVVVDNTYKPNDPRQIYAVLYGHALDGNTAAQHRLAIMCRNGEGTTKDPVEAVKWFRLAAEEGKAESQEELALALLSGNGVGQDSIEALKWLSRASNQNSPSALYMLANMYMAGDVVSKDKQKAYKLFQQSAKLGFSRSLIKQADMLIYGNGIKKNVYEGLLLYKQAQVTGDSYAKTKYPELEKQKLCLFSAKTQLFGKYLKCVSGKELRMKMVEKGAKLVKGDNHRYKKIYDSKKILKGSETLEIDLLQSDKIARLKYTFETYNPDNRDSSNININYFKKIKNILKRKYGKYKNSNGVIGVGEVEMTWRLKDNVKITLYQKSFKFPVILEYSFPDRMKEFLVEQNQKKNNILNKSYALDQDVF